MTSLEVRPEASGSVRSAPPRRVLIAIGGAAIVLAGLLVAVLRDPPLPEVYGSAWTYAGSVDDPRIIEESRGVTLPDEGDTVVLRLAAGIQAPSPDGQYALILDTQGTWVVRSWQPEDRAMLGSTSFTDEAYQALNLQLPEGSGESPDTVFFQPDAEGQVTAALWPVSAEATSPANWRAWIAFSRDGAHVDSLIPVNLGVIYPN